MFGSNVLEVAIGLVFVYLLLSLLCSTINEQVIARFFALRAKTLEEGITNMLATPQGKELVNQLYENPLIKGLSQNAASGKPRKPSYIPRNSAIYTPESDNPSKRELNYVKAQKAQKKRKNCCRAKQNATIYTKLETPMNG
jgi:hypothetical protein